MASNTIEMKKLLLLTLFFVAFLGCERETEPPFRMEERLHGNWRGYRINNHLIAKGLWDTLHPHSISGMIATFDTLNNYWQVDSFGEVVDTGRLVINTDSVMTVEGAQNAVDWSFDRTMIDNSGTAILSQLEAAFSGNMEYQIMRLNDFELILYFDTVVPINYGGFEADVELRHTEYWRK